MPKGRPKKKPVVRKSEPLNVKVTPREKSMFQTVADHVCEGNLSYWVRTTLKNAAQTELARIDQDESDDG